jgi:hypothetical protein
LFQLGALGEPLQVIVPPVTALLLQRTAGAVIASPTFPDVGTFAQVNEGPVPVPAEDWVVPAEEERADEDWLTVPVEDEERTEDELGCG